MVFSPLKIYTMVGKTICLFRKQPTGCYRPVSEPPCPWRFGELLLAKESPQQTRRGSFTSGAPTVTALCQLSGCLVLWRIYDSPPYPTGNLLSLVSNGVGWQGGFLFKLAPTLSSLKSCILSQTGLDPGPVGPGVSILWGAFFKEKNTKLQI